MADTKILDIIGEHSALGSTGTVMAVFKDNSIGRFYIVGGIPATARYRNRQGEAAMNLAMETDVQSSSFHNEADLVRSAEILNGVAVPAAPVSPAVRRAAPPLQPVVPVGQQLTELMRAALEDLLSDYIGPVAPLIVADLPSPVAISTAITRLSSEIPDPAQTNEFIRAARAVTS